MDKNDLLADIVWKAVPTATFNPDLGMMDGKPLVAPTNYLLPESAVLHRPGIKPKDIAWEARYRVRHAWRYLKLAVGVLFCG